MKKALAILSFCVMAFASFSCNATLPTDNDMTQTINNQDSIYIEVDKLAEFPKGEKALENFIKKNLYYPTECVCDGVQGEVQLALLIEKDGSISQILLINEIDIRLARAAMDMVKKMPNWIPAEKDGKPVRSYYILPVKFRLR